jgi:imidazolonepropionase
MGPKRLPNWDFLLTDANIATMRSGIKDYGAIENAALAIAAGRIAWVGPMSELPADSTSESRSRSVEGRWLTPALIDCHTHLVFAGDRAVECEQRLNGASYEEIARAGGGIRSTVSATRLADKGMLLDSARSRIDALVQEGVATIEIKSGYGLNLETELTMLEAARTLGSQYDAEIVTTFLGAHSVPTEFDRRADDYILVFPLSYMRTNSATAVAQNLRPHSTRCRPITSSTPQRSESERLPMPVR